MKKLFILIAPLMVLILVLSACSGSQTSPTPTSQPATTAPPTTTLSTTASAKPTPAPSPTPQYGGILKIINRQAPTIFGYPAEADPISASVGRTALEGITWVDNYANPSPRLATSWEVSADGKSLTYTLRKGVKFHDGTDFDAAAVKWNFDNYISLKPLSPITSVDVVDPYTVRFNLSQFSNVIYPTLAFIGLISPTAFQKNGKEWARINPVGTGPFKFVDFQRDVSVKYDKFADYWDKGKPYLDGIQYSFIVDPLTGSMAFQNGDAQMITQLAPKDASDLKAKGYNVVSMPGTVAFLAPDSANSDSPFANKSVREAVEYAIDKKAIVDAVGYGFWATAYQLSPSQFPGYNTDLKGRTYNPAQAKQLLAAAGYPNGFQTTLTAQTTDNRDALVAIQANLKAVGIDAALDIVDSAKYLQMRTKGWKNGLIIGGTGADPNQNQRLSADLGNTSGYYVSTLRPPAWQPAMDQSMAARDMTTRTPLMAQMLKIASDEAMVTPLWVTSDIGAEVKGLTTDYLAYHHVQWKPGEAWLSK